MDQQEVDQKRIKACLLFLSNIRTEIIEEWIAKGFKPVALDPTPRVRPVYPISEEE